MTKNWLIGGAAAAIICVCVLLAIIVFNTRDEASYRAGHQAGFYSRDPGLSESQIRDECAHLARTVAKQDVYHYIGGEIKGRDVDVDDFTNGCVDGALGR